MHVGLVKVKYSCTCNPELTQMHHLQMLSLDRYVCTSDHNVTASNTIYLSAACCRQESQVVGYLQRAWGACHVCLHCWKPPTWQAHAFPGRTLCLHATSLHFEVSC